MKRARARVQEDQNYKKKMELVEQRRQKALEMKRHNGEASFLTEIDASPDKHQSSNKDLGASPEKSTSQLGYGSPVRAKSAATRRLLRMQDEADILSKLEACYEK